MDIISQLITLPGTVIVDVRTPAEFSAGHVAKSVNIPLPDLSNHLNEFKEMKYIIFCCASGVRSLKASQLLKQHNIGCYDGGTWVNIDKFLNN
ncbi:rhodanese-like domain-containing protein [Mucilaginibacter sp.]|uniref:rhodanese-like domain-containing protein n=1 Tax=Mucilaginibacter sp. TaxID=1882438 RepID=UPI0025F36964|nr:rhodanese-like domain-containing protein [Mucilaginibacter sp.]